MQSIAMAQEPDNLVLIQLREIRATLAERFAQIDQRFAQIDQRFAQIDLRFAHMDKRFDEIDKRIDDFHALTSHTLMLGTSSLLKVQDLGRRYELSEGEQRSLRDRVDALERLVSPEEMPDC